MISLSWVVFGAVLLSCTSGRSTEAYCSSFESSVKDLRGKYMERAETIRSNQDPMLAILLMFGSVVEAQGDLVAMFDRLEKKAPDEISAETTAVRDSLKSQLESTGKSLDATLKDPLDPTSPMTGLGSSIVSGLANMGAYNKIGHFIQENCDLSSIATG